MLFRPADLWIFPSKQHERYVCTNRINVTWVNDEVKSRQVTGHRTLFHLTEEDMGWRTGSHAAMPGETRKSKQKQQRPFSSSRPYGVRAVSTQLLCGF